MFILRAICFALAEFCIKARLSSELVAHRRGHGWMHLGNGN